MIISKTRATLVVPLVVSIGLQGCTTVGGASYASTTAMDRAIGKCLASTVISAGLGALAGAAIDGGRGAGRGALIGTAVGVGACAVLLQIAAEEDRTRVREAELAAIESNTSSTRAFVSRSGKSIAVSTRVASAPVPTVKPDATAKPSKGASGETKPQFTACRYSEQTVSVDGQSAGSGKQLWCRLDTGDWKPIKS
ncbi:hypothetical protein NXC12_PD00422 (plasmid) [Rhizobium etli]|uniref:Surface antigen n=1 Tax=Rhizobium etli TaxID=29449 RepID=A0AAN1ENF2_RHIET|nr:hypothetical protein NXC12_PD00422 [Rhizobium etli]